MDFRESKVMSWTDERVETLKKLWQEGHSASQIAKALGGVTRNAVIGKVHRLGLSGRAAPSQPSRPLYKPARPPRPAASTHHASGHASSHTPVVRRTEPLMARPVISQPIVPYVEEPGTATVLTLGAKMCKWPIGDPSSDAFSFCGRRADDGTPYCVEHARVAYQPSQKKKRDTGAELSRSLRRYL
jgi:GcrA cell cycle regulator